MGGKKSKPSQIYSDACTQLDDKMNELIELLKNYKSSNNQTNNSILKAPPLPPPFPKSRNDIRMRFQEYDNNDNFKNYVNDNNIVIRFKTYKDDVIECGSNCFTYTIDTRTNISNYKMGFEIWLKEKIKNVGNYIFYFPNKINFLDDNSNKTIQEIYQKLKVSIKKGGNPKLTKKNKKKKSNKKRTKQKKNKQKKNRIKK